MTLLVKLFDSAPLFTSVNCLVSSKYWFHRHFDVTKVGFSIITEKKDTVFAPFLT